MQIEFLESFDKDIDRLNNKAVNNKLLDIISSVQNAVKYTDIRNIKKLQGHKFAYRIRVGDYRIGVFIENGIVEFARIIHRKEIYNNSP